MIKKGVGNPLDFGLENRGFFFVPEVIIYESLCGLRSPRRPCLATQYDVSDCEHCCLAMRWYLCLIIRQHVKCNDIISRTIFYITLKKDALSNQWSGQKSGGDSAVRFEFLIAGMIFHPSRVKSEVLHK